MAQLYQILTDFQNYFLGLISLVGFELVLRIMVLLTTLPTWLMCWNVLPVAAVLFVSC